MVFLCLRRLPHDVPSNSVCATIFVTLWLVMHQVTKNQAAAAELSVQSVSGFITILMLLQH